MKKNKPTWNARERNTMKLKYNFETTELGEEIIAVPVGDKAREFSGVINLNDSAATILKLLQEETTVERIVSALMEKYEGDKEEITVFVEKFINKLKSENLLNE